MNIAANPSVQTDQTVYLKDYQKPVFLVDSVDLNIRVFDQQTLVDATLIMQRQTPGELVLLGRDLELKAVKLNGQLLNPEDYQLDSEQLVIFNAPDQAMVETQVVIHPESNTQLEGLYLAGGLCLLGISLLQPEALWPLLLPLFVTVASLGCILPNASACALAGQASHAGSASALLGFLQFSLAALASTLVGVLHNGTAQPMALVISVCGVLAVTCATCTAGNRNRA